MEETGMQVWNAASPWMEAAASFIFTFALPFLLRELFKWLRSKSHSAAFACAMEKAEKAAQLGLEVTEQTLVGKLKKAREDGQLTPEEAKDAMQSAMKHAVQSLGERQLKEMEGCLGLAREEVTDLLERLIESKLHQKKALAA